MLPNIAPAVAPAAAPGPLVPGPDRDWETTY